MTLSKGSFELRFIPEALKEWNKLDNSVRQPLVKRLKARLAAPQVENERLSGDLRNCYKIKDNKSGFRLVYVFLQDEGAVVVLSVGKRESLSVYISAIERLSNSLEF